MRTLLCGLVLVGMAFGAAPPARLTPEQEKLLRERNALWIASQKAWKAGKQAEAIAALEKVLELQQRVNGPSHRLTAVFAEYLGEVHQARGEWEQEAKYRRVRIEALRGLLGEGHYRTVDARLALAEALAQPKRTPARRAALARARGLNEQAVALSRKGQAAKAIPIAKQALQIKKEALGEKHPSYAIGLNTLALLYKDMGDHKQALPLFQKAQEVFKEALGEKHPSHATSLNNLATLYESMGDHKSALPLHKQALSIRKEVLGEKHPHYALSLNNLALLYQHMGDRKAAMPLYKQALAIRKEVLGEKHPEYAVSLNNLALLYKDMGDHKQALPLSKQALQIKKEALGEKHPLYATSLNNLASLYQDMGEYKTALSLYKQALVIRKEVLGERHPHYTHSLNHLARLSVTTGDYEGALSLHKQVTAIHKDAWGEKHPDYATCLHSMGLMYGVMGDYKTALPLLRAALVIRKDALGEQHRDYATSLNDLASLYWSMGDPKGALPLLQRAIRIRKEALGEKHPLYAESLHNLAGVYRDLGEYKAALPLYRQALQIKKEAQGEKHYQYAGSLNSLANLYLMMGEHEAALPLYQKSRDTFKEALGERHPYHARAIFHLAWAYSHAGQYGSALPLSRRALALRKEALGEGHPEYAACLRQLASLSERVGDRKTALALSERGATLALSQLRAVAPVQSDRQQFAAADAVRSLLDFRLSLPDVGGYAHLLAWKGIVLMRQRQRRLFTALAAGPKTRKAAEELQATTRQIAALCGSARPAREQLRRLTQEQERLQAELSLLSSEAGEAFREKPLTPAGLSEALPEGAVLVDYLFHWQGGITYRDGRPNPVRHLVAFVSRRGKPTARVDLGPAGKAKDALREWRHLLVQGKADGPLGAEVKGLIWSPLEKHLLRAKVILVSPDETLASVPFAALPGKKEGSYLLEDVALAVVPVPQMLPEMLRPVDKAKRLKPSLLVVGDVDYDRTGLIARTDKASDRGAPLGVRRAWPRLPATFDEAASVSKSFTDLFEEAPIALGKGKATKAKVRQALTKVRYAHLATHGFFAAEGVKSALRGDEKPDAFFGRGGVTGWHPLLLSGLALAGANREPREGEEDGILTALEVSEMELPKLELVVLSACETGLGKSAGGEGLLGLQRAFQVAGARTVVASLWAVDDRTTQALMGEFYRIAWDTDSIVSRAEALRRAQLSILKEGIRRGLGKKAEKLPKGEKGKTRLPPLYWAAFVLSGDWR
jgi:CHAT domain-containing protein/tetratricopeptide (TPR) repeat protein